MGQLQHQPVDEPKEALWPATGAVALTTGLAFVVYLFTLAPSITWAHHGADGGEFLAAAMVNGVPHPPGYPLYTMLLQGWLALWGALLPESDLAWRGNLFSACCAALSCGVTVLVLGYLLAGRRHRWFWAAWGSLAWAFSLLLWSQAVITEVYALHALALVSLAWAVLVRPLRLWTLTLIVMVGVANHLTFLLLLPAAAYYLWTEHRGAGAMALLKPAMAIAVGLVLGAAFYLRIPLVASGPDGVPPPVNWGYADNWDGFWWLVSGQAYRGYLFGLTADTVFARVSTWAATIVDQFTALGVAIALMGLAYLDAAMPRLRNFAILWILPISVYAVSYYTRDSEVYLLALVWMLAVWMTLGAVLAVEWLAQRLSTRIATIRTVMIALCAVALLSLVVWRLPHVSLAGDMEAVSFLDSALQVVEPGSIIISSADAETFALWYGAWGSGLLLENAPDAVLVNYALYQFDWYRRLMADLYPHVPAVDEDVPALLAANQGLRPIYFSEELSVVPADRLYPRGSLWRYE